jgi:hypothetical protein
LSDLQFGFSASQIVSELKEEHSKSATVCVYRTAHSEDGILTYLVPYLPVTPTFLVRLVILADVAWMNYVMEVGGRRLDVVS